MEAKGRGGGGRRREMRGFGRRQHGSSLLPKRRRGDRLGRHRRRRGKEFLPLEGEEEEEPERAPEERGHNLLAARAGPCPPNPRGTPLHLL